MRDKSEFEKWCKVVLNEYKAQEHRFIKLFLLFLLKKIYFDSLLQKFAHFAPHNFFMIQKMCQVEASGRLNV